MWGTTMPDSGEGNRVKAARHREKLRTQGLRPIQISIPDARTSEFLEEAHRQSLLISDEPDAAVMLKFMRAMAAWR
jgi:hypothetical protein